MKKILLAVLDGLGDEPIPELNNQTPLQAANTPYFDCLSQQGLLGLAKTDFSGALPTSEEGHFQLFGYDPKELGLGRGMVTAAGSGIELQKGDVALRGNLAHVENGQAVDRRAGRIKNPGGLIDALNQIELDGVKVIVKSAKRHRLGIVLRGQGLSSQISDSDPFYSDLDTTVRQVKPLDNSPEAEKSARILNEFLQKAHQVLSKQPLNLQRQKKGLPLANYVLTRGASSYQRLKQFEEKYGLSACCVAGKVLYKQIARMLGMEIIEVEGADGSMQTNLEGKIRSVNQALAKFDFVFLHIKATDSLAEDGKYKQKKDFIEKIDQEMKMLDQPGDTIICVTSDHSTCSLKKRHCSLSCPVLIWGKGKGGSDAFSEAECKKGKLGKFKQINLMEKLTS